MPSNTSTLRTSEVRDVRMTPQLPNRRVRARGLLLGMASLAAITLSGCVVTEVGYEPGPRYYPYSGDYYGNYGPYSNTLVLGGIYRGGHHYSGNSFGHVGGNRAWSGGFARGGAGAHANGARAGHR